MVVAVEVEVGDVGDGDEVLEDGWAKFGWTRGFSIFPLSSPKFLELRTSRRGKNLKSS